MELKRTGAIRYKVFKKIDIEKLMIFFINLNEEIVSQSTERQTELRLEIDFKDGTSIKGTSLSILNDTQEIKSLNFSVKNIYVKKRASISINSSYFFNNEYIVESEDEDWVNAKFRKLEEIIDKVPNQNQWLSNEKKQTTVYTAVGIPLGLIILISLIFQYPGDELTLIPLFIVMYISITAGIMVSQRVFEKWIFSAYPQIDIDTTLDHLNENGKKKKIIKGFVLLAAIPITINLLFLIIS